MAIAIVFRGWIARLTRRMAHSTVWLVMWPSLWLTAGTLLAGPVRADVVTLNKAIDTLPLGRHLAVLEDSSGKMELADIMGPSPTPLAWRPGTKDSLQFGYSRSAFWLHADLRNAEPPTSGSVTSQPTPWLLGLRYPLLDHIDVYIVRADGRVEHHASGDRRAFATRSVKDRNFYFTLSLNPGEQVRAYVRIQGQGSLQVPLVITTPDAQRELAHAEQWLFGIYGGAMLAMLAYNLMLSLSLRDRAYLQYVMYVALFGVAQAVLTGLAFAYVWPRQPNWGNLAAPVFMALTGWSLLAFSRGFLDLRLRWPRLDTVSRHLQWLFLAAVPACVVLPYAWMIQFMTVAGIVAPALALGATVWLLRQGLRQARYFLAAFAGLMVGIVLTSLHMFGLVPASMWTAYGLQIGSLLEFTLLSFALAHRLKLAYEDNERLQRANAAELEARVQARTQDLDNTLNQLTETNQRLQALTEQDPLTGLKNRMFLSQQLGETWRHALRHGEPLTALMIDIDNFKRINDEHGHMVGDEALRQVAHLIDQIAQRPGDHAVRYGGEEFLVLLPNTHLAGAAHVAERIRRKVEALKVRSADKAIPLTVSIGVACAHATSEGNPQSLITAADRLLYQAKQNGRNQCALHPEARVMSPALLPLLKPAGKPAPASSPQA